MRRTHLEAGRGITIHAEDKGKEDARIILHGSTEAGAEHEIVLRLDSWYLARLTVEIRDHFAALAANEASRRAHRERALRMPEAPRS